MGKAHHLDRNARLRTLSALRMVLEGVWVSARAGLHVLPSLPRRGAEVKEESKASADACWPCAGHTAPRCWQCWPFRETPLGACGFAVGSGFGPAVGPPS